MSDEQARISLDLSEAVKRLGENALKVSEALNRLSKHAQDGDQPKE